MELKKQLKLKKNMSEFTPEEIEGIVKAMSQASEIETPPQIPLRPLGTFTTLSKLTFAPFDEEKPRPLLELTEKEIGKWKDLKITLDVLFASSKITLGDLASLEEGHLITFEQLAEEPVDIYVNGKRIARGEIILADGNFGVKILSFE
jgi:flagellar motor switch protein FliN/FliY